MLSPEGFFRDLREEFIARRFIQDILLGIARFIPRARMSAKLLNGQTNARAVNISGNDIKVLPPSWIVRSEGPTILRDA